MEATYTEQQMIDIGGNPWTSPDGTKHRVYFNKWPDMTGFSYSKYNTGNISSASVDGNKLANNRAAQLLNAKVYWEAGTIHTTLPNYEDTLRRVPASIYSLIDQINETIAERVAALPAPDSTAGAES